MFAGEIYAIKIALYCFYAVIVNLWALLWNLPKDKLPGGNFPETNTNGTIALQKVIFHWDRFACAGRMFNSQCGLLGRSARAGRRGTAMETFSCASFCKIFLTTNL